MRITSCLIALPFLCASALAGSAGCSEDKPDPLATPSVDGGSSEDAGGPTLDAPSIPCTDPPETVYANPGSLSADANARGELLRCAKEADLGKDAMQAKATELGYGGRSFTSDAQVYRISYRTERGDSPSTPSVSSAFVYIPKTPRAAKLPIVVAGRGSRGQAERCAVTKLDPSLEGINDDFYRMVYPLIGSGYAVVVPDLAGYANSGAPGNPPSAYAQAVDVAHSTLDGSRALKKLFPALDDKVVLVGHSQGGHSVLASLALAASYGAAAPIVGTVAFAPLWLSQRSWGAVLYTGVATDYPIAEQTSIANVSVWYHYTQAELLDGPGEGKKLFKPEHQAAIESFVNTECWGSTALTTLGASYIYELFDNTMVTQVGFASTSSSPCAADRPLCEKWLTRYSADRPHLTGAATQVPILVTYGMKDTTIPPNRMRCAVDRLKQDTSNVTFCVDPELEHGSVVSGKGEYVADWIASVALGAPAPAACANNESLLTEECATPPPND